MTIQQAVAIEPKLDAILQTANRIREGGKADWPDYSRLKMQGYRLVGDHAADPRLMDSDTYDSFIRALTEALGL